MNTQIVVVALIAILIGICTGAIIVLLLVIQRRRQRVDSMGSGSNAVGRIGVVEIPFNRTCKGKVRVNIKGLTVDLIACTDDDRDLHTGDRVLIVEARGNQVFVVST